MTPLRIVELRCPSCDTTHWEYDNDFRDMSGEFVPYHRRAYVCPHCRHEDTGYALVQASPPEFFLQPDEVQPMSLPDFEYWLHLLQAHFPGDGHLSMLGISWYPGLPQHDHDSRLRATRQLGRRCGYNISLSSWELDQSQLKVAVQGSGEAVFWVRSSIELDVCYFGFDQSGLDEIGTVLQSHRGEVLDAFERYCAYATPMRDRWLTALDARLVTRNGA